MSEKKDRCQYCRRKIENEWCTECANAIERTSTIQRKIPGMQKIIDKQNVDLTNLENKYQDLILAFQEVRTMNNENASRVEIENYYRNYFKE